ncbi:hypothetical protein BST81_08415 [Leptolyngbya sp. 'hensonii']|uniref:YaaW family protein n=1 Tax=Leptolyngbya sp. 'hensonii' TaxID=1922337 RepID=UPI0009500B45|nr:YaaW family protein [Leptolyngbya sp. 'hensonii']OLP18926.1 hypothetical protein BST81_08415 [Leptolyngbya sp. 'hensonii']
MADELRLALELATEDELRDLTDILFRPKFNPIDYLYAPDPIDIQSRDRDDWLDTLERRVRFLAADGMTVLRRRTGQVSYRQILIRICRYLRIPYSASCSTTDLEAEVFLHLLERAWKHLPKSERGQLTAQVQRSLAKSNLAEQLPLPMRQDPIGLLLRGGSILTISTVLRPLVLHHIARQFALHFASYQIARQAVLEGGAVAAAQLSNHLTLQMARRGMTITAARYGAARTVFAFLGPALWAWFFADLGWRAISTNYGRIIPTVFALAQIRLIRAECFEPV